MHAAHCFGTFLRRAVLVVAFVECRHFVEQEVLGVGCGEVEGFVKFLDAIEHLMRGFGGADPSLGC